jgi:cellulose synthase/poly-beta-1,6-N-acetylglucosamine synthase-like glycosyltransferase
MIILSVLAGCLAAALLLPSVSDLVSIVAAATRGRPHDDHEPGTADRPSFLFLVPAHDEGAIVGSCVRSLLDLDYPKDRRHVVVVADNCSDDTATIAEEGGAQVLRRYDPALRGKPQAIAWALSRLDLRAFDAVVVMDADSVADPGLARELAGTTVWKGVAAQVYCGVENPEASALTRMSSVLANARYVFLYPLKERAGVNVPLMGNGMVFSSDILIERGWDAFSICEDWEMYAILTREGYPIVGNPAARIYAQEAQSLKQSESQRQRWAAGKITVFRREIVATLRSRRIGWRQKLDALAELSHLGPAVHLGVVALACAILLALPVPYAGGLCLLLLLGLLRTVAVSALAVSLERKPLATLGSFLFLPIYTVWRLVVQVGSLRMVGDKPWVKTERNP